MNTFYNDLSKAGKAAILSIIPGFSDDYVQDYSDYSSPLSLLYDPSCLVMKFNDLLAKYESVFRDISITETQAKKVEVATREQSW